MITPLQVKKALSMRESKMSWPEIAEVLGENLEDLVAAVQKQTGRIIRPEALLPTARDAAKDSSARETIEGFVVVRNAEPPPPVMRSSALTGLLTQLRIGDKVVGIKRPVAASLKKGLVKMRGWGAEMRVSPTGRDLVDLWVLAEPTRRQREMSVLMQQRHAARVSVAVKNPRRKTA